ncbi:hypothetical protein BTH55_03160 [Lactobacillus delbrueckii subsp. bulgaricus]|nr:hypothetical protein [Lactobacillus delbrueckii subsp. bulgaricus]MBT8856830.1 hypothetical protein [Lactobacillus delbrueckii subsp. bulgaricus]MBT8866553.1 hypothetical protein [Lactobacillus delbrueckii subsp. bulgaricus]
MFDQIEEFMESLLKELPEDEQAKVDHQVYYDTDKNSLQFMLEVNGTSPHFWMYYAKSGWGAVECWIKKDGTMEGAIFHDPDIEPIQEFNNAAKFDGNLAEFVRTDLIDAGRLTKLREGKDTTYYVINTADDGSDAYAVKFGNKPEAEEYLHTEQYNFRERTLLTEEQFWSEYSKDADAYASEEEAAEDGYAWDDQHDRWINIDVVNPGLLFYKGVPKSLQFKPLSGII